MKQKYSFEDCYKILNTNTECSWNALRKSYKLLIQKWHPDRYKDGSTEKHTAEEKIKELNKAYQQLLKYYRKNGALPRIEPTKPRSEQKNTNQNSAQSRPQTPSFTEPKKRKKPEKTGRKNKAPTRIAVFASIVAIIISYSSLDFSTDRNSIKSEPKNPLLDRNYIRADPHHSLEHDKSKTTKYGADVNTRKKKNKTKKIHKQFTYGSSIVDVIMIQGTPTKVEGDTWYYGESKVYFHNGIVQRWERKLGSPLSAGITLKKAVQKKHGFDNTLIH